ncbi:hypothetical protein UlMin_027466 [Ulmus minor]
MYLGLPTFSMRNKRVQFGFIWDRVMKKLQGWKEKFFSQRGKEVLLKAVVQAIPTYAMSYFSIPDSIIRKIESACARFWWGTTPDHKRVHWLKWEELCKSKSLGGLGLNDLSTFNQAMLGRQVWRLLSKPYSFMARVFKAKYFPFSSIWEASAGDNSSYTWKSIMWGRNLVARGIRWRIGDGASTLICQSWWLPKPWDFKVSSPMVLPLSAPSIQQASSSSNSLASWWNLLWSVHLPPKIKHFLWRAVHDFLPTSWNLLMHHIPATAICALWY